MLALRIGLAGIVLAGAASSALALQISVPALEGGTWDQKYVANIMICSGQNVSPEIVWSDPPAGTQSYALTVFDPDAPTGSGWWHWQVWNIPATATGLAEGAGAPGGAALPAGAMQSKGDAGIGGFLGPCPPAGPAHRYVFTIYALGTDALTIDPNASGAMVGFMVNSAVLGQASVTYTYGQP